MTRRECGCGGSSPASVDHFPRSKNRCHDSKHELRLSLICLARVFRAHANETFRNRTRGKTGRRTAIPSQSSVYRFFTLICSNIRSLSVLAAPSRPEPFWFLPNCSLLARMQGERLVHHRAFLHGYEIKGDQPQSSLLPAPQYEQISGQVRRARSCGRCSCAE